MSAFAERLNPPAPTRTPHDHFVIADRLAAEIDAMQPHDLVLPHGKAKMALADLHARLAQCAPPDSTDMAVRTALDECQHCGADILKLPIGKWVHLPGFRFTCIHSTEHTATPTEGN